MSQVAINDGAILVRPVPEEAEEEVRIKRGVNRVGVAYVEVNEAEPDGREVNQSNKGNRGPLGCRLLPDPREW